jgi:hypothetical protein
MVKPPGTGAGRACAGARIFYTEGAESCEGEGWREDPSEQHTTLLSQDDIEKQKGEDLAVEGW